MRAKQEDPKQREMRRLNKLINSLCTMDVVGQILVQISMAVPHLTLSDRSI